MTTVLLRRKKLGFTSCKGISSNSTNSIQTIRNDKVFPPNTDLVFRWGTTTDVPTNNVVNTAKAIHLVNNKREFRKILNENNLCPKTWFSINEFIGEENYPVILRRKTHAQGRNLHLCNNYEDLCLAADKYGEGNYYFSEFINKVEEYRVFVVQGRVACVAKKTPANPNEIAWNVAKGGRFDNVNWGDWPLKAVKKSIEAFNLSGLDFGGVDVMIDADNNAYIIEINSAPSLTSPYRQQCMAKTFDYIIENGKKKIPLINQLGGWKKFIHPAISDKALILDEVI